MRNPAPGHLYVLEVTDGVTKVGYSDMPEVRLGKHADDLQKTGRAITRQWVSPRHAEAFLRYKAAGVDTKYISAMLGHSLFPEVAREAAEAAAAVVPMGRTDTGGKR